ncbi:retrovirus-related pol polyprotein from transposon TNT 1-94 [Tanacetum coccineum]
MLFTMPSWKLVDIRNKLDAEAKTVHMILTGIDNDIYSIVDAYLETNLYWEFGKFTSRDGESLESYYSRFVTLVKQSQKLKIVSYHKLYDILKQHQNEVNEIRAERLSRTANPLALVAQQQPLYNPQTNPTHYTQNSPTRSQQANTKNRGKAIVNSLIPIYDPEPAMVAEDDEMSKKKEIDKLMALISLSFKKIYKPTNNNLRTSSNTSRANQDNSLRINKGTRYDNQREVDVVGARETVAREYHKPKRAKDSAYHKEKMLLCKQEEDGIKLSAEQVDWRDDTDDELEDQKLEVQIDDHNYNVFAIDKPHHEQPESVNATYLDEQGDNHIIFDSLDMSTNGDQADQDDDDLAKERGLLAFLIDKLKCEIDDSKNRVIPTTNVSRPQLKRNRLEDRVMHNNSQGKKQEVEDHRRNFKFSNKKTFVTACNGSLNAKTSNVNFVYVACGKCVLNDNHDMCVLHYINGMNSRTKQPIIVPISTKEPKRTVNQSIATSLKKIVALESTNQKPRSTIRKQYEHVIKTCRRWYSKTTPAGYKWKPKSSTTNAKSNVSVPLGIQSRTTNISEHMTLRKSTLSNTSSSFNHFSSHRDNPIHHRLWVLKAHDDLVQGNVTIKRVYYVKGLNHNLFSVGQFCDADFEVAFQKSTCYARDSRGSDLYSITLQDTTSPNLIFLMAKATSSQAWLWHRHLSHMNFDTSTCFRKSFNGKKYVLVIVDDYSRYTWSYFLRSKNETHEVLINFLTLVQRGLNAQVRTVRTDKGTEFLYKTLHAYFNKEGIEHQTSVGRTPKQKGIVERRNSTLVEAARTMLSPAKVPLFFWAQAIATTCFTQNRSLLIPRHEKTLVTSSMAKNHLLNSYIFLAPYATSSKMVKVLTK